MTSEEVATSDYVIPILKVVNLVGVSVELPSPHPVVVLREVESPWREIRMSIGYSEGIAITYAWRRLPSPRPLTHEVWVDILNQFNISLEVIRIKSVVGSVYFAEMVLVGGKKTFTVPCRPTDAITLALRQEYSVPILAAESVLAGEN